MPDNNTLILVSRDGTRNVIEAFEGLTVTFGGKDSVVEIAEFSRFRNTRITMGDGGLVSIGRTRRMINTVIDLSGSGQGKKLTIGAGTTIEGARFAMGGSGPRSVAIGTDCMLSSQITFRPSDGHAVFDLDTGRVINHSRPIIVGNHVWIGAGVTLVKGSQLADNTIVGTAALVSRKFLQENIAVAGNPADVVRTNIGWDRAHVEEYVESPPIS